MLAPLRRKFVALTFIAAFLMLFSYFLVSKRLYVVSGVSSFINGSSIKIPGLHGTKPSQNASTTKVNGNSEAQTIANLTSATSTASATPQPATQQKSLVVARLKRENTDWIKEKLPDWPAAIYTVDDPDAELHTRNKGHEASVYLTYIIDNYDKLPEVTIFIHSHQMHKHGTKRDRLFQGIDYDNFESIRALKLDFVTKNGFANLRCLNNPGCPSEIQPFRPENERDPLRPQEPAMVDAWKELFQDDDVPHVLAAPCCAQFAVSKDQIRQRGKDEYERYLNWLYNTPLDDATSGRVFEYLWHVIFGKPHVFCPDEEQCYVDQYGTSSKLVHMFQNTSEHADR